MVIKFETLQGAIIFMEIEDLDRSAWGEEPSDRTFKQCPCCLWFHDAKSKCCSFKCSFLSIFR